MTLLDLKIYMEEKIFTESPYRILPLDKEIKEFIKDIPKSPGVYKFLDKIYILFILERQNDLTIELLHIFRKSSRSKKGRKFLLKLNFIEFALTNTELESLLHEQYLIKEIKPKFNVQFKG